MTKQNGVDVWPNAAIWMRNELRSKVMVLLTMRAHGLIAHTKYVIYRVHKHCTTDQKKAIVRACARAGLPK